MAIDLFCFPRLRAAVRSIHADILQLPCLKATHKTGRMEWTAPAIAVIASAMTFLNATRDNAARIVIPASAWCGGGRDLAKRGSR
jgi:hypothetical protein